MMARDGAESIGDIPDFAQAFQISRGAGLS
jgi:hypothetical protein